MTLSSAMFWNHRGRIVELAAKSRLPAMFPEREFADEGGLMTYGPHVPDNYRRPLPLKPTKVDIKSPYRIWSAQNRGLRLVRSCRQGLSTLKTVLAGD
jgi:hypothetical protein